MKKLIVSILLLSLSSCFLLKENGIDFKINNHSDYPISNVKFSTVERLLILKFDRIEPNESVSEFLSMKNNKRDGSYILEFTREGGKKEKSVDGYYTNGGSLDRWVEFNIESDTIQVNFSGPGY